MKKILRFNLLGIFVLALPIQAADYSSRENPMEDKYEFQEPYQEATGTKLTYPHLTGNTAEVFFCGTGFMATDITSQSYVLTTCADVLSRFENVSVSDIDMFASANGSILNAEDGNINTSDISGKLVRSVIAYSKSGKISLDKGIYSICIETYSNKKTII